MLWSTQGKHFGTIFEAINKIPMIFAPAVTTVLVLGVFWKRGNNAAALTTFAVGCGLGLIYFILDMPNVGCHFLKEVPAEFKGLVTDPRVGPGIPFMLVGPMLCALCIVTYIIVSLSTAPPSAAQLENSCWGSPLKALSGKFAGLTDPRLISLLLFVLMVVLYLFLK
jgi:SSS family solute:Na+ symporter